jgi:hypothetical protein
LTNYSKGGSYHHFAGKDAARAYVTGCFEDHLTHDMRGLSYDQIKVSIKELNGEYTSNKSTNQW